MYVYECRCVGVSVGVCVCVCDYRVGWVVECVGEVIYYVIIKYMKRFEVKVDNGVLRRC